MFERPGTGTFAERKAAADIANAARRDRHRLVSLGVIEEYGETGGRESKTVRIEFESLVDLDSHTVYRRYRSDPTVLVEMKKPDRPDIVHHLGTLTRRSRPASAFAPSGPDSITKLDDSPGW